MGVPILTVLPTSDCVDDVAWSSLTSVDWRGIRQPPRVRRVVRPISVSYRSGDLIQRTAGGDGIRRASWREDPSAGPSREVSY